MIAVFAQAFGILMVLTAARPAGLIGIVVLALSAAALLAGLFYRRAATVAVLLSIGAMALADPSPFFAAVSGLSAAAYLVVRYADDSDAVAVTMPTAVGLLGFTAAGLAATAVDIQVKWVPLLAPGVVVAILILVAMPMWSDERTALASGASDPSDTSDTSR